MAINGAFKDDLDLLFFLTSNLIFTCDLDGAFQDLNPAWESCLGWAQHELQREPLFAFIHEDDRQATRKLFEALGRGEEVRGFTNRMRHKDGTYRHLVWDCLSLAELRLVYAIGRDVTEQKRMEERSRATETQLRLFVEHTPAAVAMLDRDMRHLLVSHRWYSDFRLENGSILGKPLNEVFPELPAGWRDVHQKGLEGLVSTGDDEPFYRADGTVDWLRWEVHPWHAPDGAVGGVIMFVEVVTERRRQEESLRESEERFRSAFDNAPIGMALVSLKWRVQEVNRALCALTGYDEVSLSSCGLRDLIHPGYTELVFAGLGRIVEGHAPSFDQEIELLSKSGDEVWVQFSASLWRHADGSPKNFILQIQDISDRKRMEDQLRILSSKDGLTGVANRRVFDETLQQEWRRAMRDGGPISMILIDVDFFKAYNDTYGHQSGDTCLQRVSGAIEQTLQRPADFVARYGGEEFAVVLPGTGQEGALQMAEAIRKAVVTLGIPHASSQIAEVVTLSLGVACRRPVKGDSPAEIVRAADEAVYQAKRAGRNRSVVAG